MNADAVSYRAVEPADAHHIVLGYEWLFEPPGIRPADWDEDVAEDRLARIASSSTAGVLAAEAGREVVGFCTIYLDIESVRFGRRAWVEDLAVRPDFRSRGVGKGLLDGAKQWAREQGATHIELDSSDARVDAHRFYQRETPTWRSVCFGWQL